jgi:predicted permease
MSLGSYWDTFLQDIRYTLRTARRDSAFFAAAIAIVALGIGANTTIFSVVHGILFRPLNFASADRLVWVANAGTGDGGLSSVTSRVANYRDWRGVNQSFEDMAAYFAFFDYGTYTMTGKGEPERLVGVGVSENFIPFLGVKLEAGRNFTPEECLDNGSPAVILSHGLWERRFGGDRSILGQKITLNDRTTTIVGVLPASFDFRSVFTPGSRSDMLVPFPITDRTDRYGNTLAVIGRLKPGVTVAQAQQEFDVINDQLRKAHPDRYSFGARLTSLQDHLTARFRRGLVVLLAAVGVVLLIACTNLSNLLLARATARRKEVAIRSALGATRNRLVRQLMTESLFVSLTGAVLGLGLSYVAIRALAALRDISIPLLATVHIDTTALLFTMAAAIATGVLMGVVPAMQVSTAHASEAMKEGGRGSSDGAGGGWARSALVVTQVALACVLLVGAGLLIRSFQRVLEVDLGFRSEHAASWRIETGQRYTSDADRLAFYERVVRRVEQVPGVDSVGMTDALPLSRDRSWGIGVKGIQYPPGQYPNAHPRIVDWRYTRAMGIKLIAGRPFDERDTATSDPVMLINRKAAQRLWPGEDAVGRIARFGSTERRVVGVVGDVRHQSVEEEAGLEAYIPLPQAGTTSMELLVRTRRDVSAVAPSVRAALLEIDRALPASEYQTLDSLIERVVSPRRFMMLLLGGFAIAALVLASVGIYGVISYSVGQRTREIGIRFALGAPVASVLRMVMGRTIALTAIGVVIGVSAALLLGQFTASLLYAMEPRDPSTFGITVAVLVLVALVAGYMPARRAARIDAAVALRSE